LEEAIFQRRRIIAHCAAFLIAFDLLIGAGAIAYRHIVAPSQAAAPAPIKQLAGTASWYGQHWRGRPTASGVRFDPNRLTAAHRTLPLDTRVRVTNLQNARSVTVLINDRGPYVGGRVIDLSRAAAHRLGMVKEGLAPVRIKVLGGPHPTTKPAAVSAAFPTRHADYAMPAFAGCGAVAVLAASFALGWSRRSET
jgi:rare lipoprotein A (peptidoglycan hydrolase)